MQLSPLDQKDLIKAKRLLDKTNIISRAKKVTNIPIIDGKVAGRTGSVPNNCVTMATKSSLVKALMRALMTFDGSNRAYFSSDLLYRKLDEASGITDRRYGVVEWITGIRDFSFNKIREIGDIAISYGEQLWTSEAQIACMVVFVLGVPNSSSVDNDSAYFTIRDELAKVVNESVAFTAEKGLTQEAIPALAEFINELGKRYETIVNLKIATDIGPVHADYYRLKINSIFIDHIHDMAHGHFTIRRLEREYSPEFIRSEYIKI